jgi:hypothetical protein
MSAAVDEGKNKKVFFLLDSQKDGCYKSHSSSRGGTGWARRAEKEEKSA